MHVSTIFPHTLHLPASKNPVPKQLQKKTPTPNIIPATEQKLHHPHPQQQPHAQDTGVHRSPRVDPRAIHSQISCDFVRRKHDQRSQRPLMYRHQHRSISSSSCGLHCVVLGWNPTVCAPLACLQGLRSASRLGSEVNRRILSLE